MILQLRIYELYDGTAEAFHARFRDHAKRIMQRHDVKIVNGWSTRHEGKPEFVYLIEWPDEQAMAERWAAFLADDEWIEIKRATADPPLVAGTTERILTAVDYI